MTHDWLSVCVCVCVCVMCVIINVCGVVDDEEMRRGRERKERREGGAVSTVTASVRRPTTASTHRHNIVGLFVCVCVW